jgi:hypothetical protein
MDSQGWGAEGRLAAHIDRGLLSGFALPLFVAEGFYWV